MSERQFRSATVRRADFGHPQSASEIVCGACGEKDHVVNTSKHRHLPPTMVAKKFEQAGWVVGSGEKADRCPACVAKLRAPKPALKVVPKEAPMVQPAPVIASVAPLAVGADLKRKINAKLFEVYDGPETGYSKGWTDQRVAEDLKVPRAAVAEIRDQFHGPAKDNEDIRDLLAKADLIFAEAAAVDGRATALISEARALMDRIGMLKKDADAIRKAVGA